MSDITITREDCMALMPRYPDKYFDLAVVDPPYGINLKLRVAADDKKWDTAPPPREYFDELFRVSKHQIIWGANYFSDKLPPCRGFVIWRKPDRTANMSFSMCEYAWTSFKTPSKYFECMAPKANGWHKGNEERIHPAQKPVKLYKKLLQWYAKPGDRILDTHLGSGSIAIACIDAGLDLTGCEIDSDYYGAAVKRIERHREQQTFFDTTEFITGKESGRDLWTT